jgi:hypothetical protein
MKYFKQVELQIKHSQQIKEKAKEKNFKKRIKVMLNLKKKRIREILIMFES